MSKTFYACNWVPSRVTEEQLTGYVVTSAWASKETIHWRVPGLENPPQPQNGEVIGFTDHLNRGFSPPGSKFFRDVLASFQIHPQDIGPNSVSNICNFQVFCEAYLQEEPTVELFRDFFYLNRRTEFTDGPNNKLGGVSIWKRKDVNFPHANIIATPKTGIRLGSIAEILLQLAKILCRVIVLTGLPISIQFPNDLLRRNELSTHHSLQSSKPLWQTV